MFSRGLLALQGPLAAQALARLAPSVAGHEIHDRRLRRDRRRALLRHALGLYRRRRLRDLDAGRRRRADRAQAAGPARGEADRPRRARFAAPRSRALPLRPRHRHHDHADRGRPAVEHRQGAPRARRLPRRRGHPEADRRGRAAQAGRPPARRQGDRARGRGDRDRRQGRRQGHVGRLRARRSAAPSPWATSSAPHSANGTKVELVVRGKPVPAEIVPMPFVKHTYYRG